MTLQSSSSKEHSLTACDECFPTSKASEMIKTWMDNLVIAAHGNI